MMNLILFFRHSSFGYTLICNDYNGYYVISNISGILICTILKKAAIEEWENTYVKIESGIFNVQNQKIKSPVMGDIMEYMHESRSAQKKISKEQSDKIVNAIKKDPKKFMDSEIYKNRLLDKNITKE